MDETTKHQPGDVIAYRSFGEIRTIKINRVSQNIKNGESGFTGWVIDGPMKGEEVWGYDHQIVCHRAW